MSKESVYLQQGKPTATRVSNGIEKAIFADGTKVEFKNGYVINSNDIEVIPQNIEELPVSHTPPSQEIKVTPNSRNHTTPPAKATETDQSAFPIVQSLVAFSAISLTIYAIIRVTRSKKDKEEKQKGSVARKILSLPFFVWSVIGLIAVLSPSPEGYVPSESMSVSLIRSAVLMLLAIYLWTKKTSQSGSEGHH